MENMQPQVLLHRLDASRNSTAAPPLAKKARLAPRTRRPRFAAPGAAAMQPVVILKELPKTLTWKLDPTKQPIVAIKNHSAEEMAALIESTASVPRIAREIDAALYRHPRSRRRDDPEARAENILSLELLAAMNAVLLQRRVDFPIYNIRNVFHSADDYKATILPMLLAETAARTHSAFKKTKGRSLRFHVSSYQISSESATLIGLVDKALRFRRGDVFLSVAFKEIVFEAATPQLGMCYAYVMDGQTDDCSNKITIQYPIMCENLRMPKSFDFLLVSNIEDAVISRRFLDTFHADPLIGFVVRPETIQRLPDTQFDNYQQNEPESPDYCSIINRIASDNHNVAAAQISVVCGGPGTGKSSLLMGIVLATLATALPLKILVCAKLPGSCNRLTEELRKRRPDFLIMRVGDVKDMDDESQSLVMNGVKIETGQAVVVATLRDSYLTRDFFEQIDVILVDDAQQASDLDLLVALALRPKKLILVGDFQQPGVVLRDASLRRRLLHRSLMHRISEMKNDNEHNPIFLLRDQHRMPLDVLLQVNRALYNGYMRAAPQLLLNGSFVHPFEMVDIVPSNVSAQIFAAFVFQVIVNDRDVYARRTIAVYAPPDVHPFMLRLRGALLRRLNVKIFKYAEIPAEEFDVVFLAVRAANRKTEDRIQMNAILSRASSLCVICGAFEELGAQSEFWGQMLTFAKQNHCRVRQTFNPRSFQHLNRWYDFPEEETTEIGSEGEDL